jgi:hypothetical protein
MKLKQAVAVLFLALAVAGCKKQQQQAAAQPVQATAINRREFAMTLPAGWTERTGEEWYDRESSVAFENDGCLVIIFVFNKSDGLMVNKVFETTKEPYEKKITDATSSPFDTWSDHNGKGLELNGKIGGAIKNRTRIFVFESGTKVCAIIESATPADFETHAEDFQMIRTSFKIKTEL